MPQISLFEYIMITAFLVSVFRSQIRGAFHRLIAGKSDKHELHSEIHGILMAVTAQASSLVKILNGFDDLMVIMSKPDDAVEMRGRELAELNAIKDVLWHICGPVGHDGVSRFSKQTVYMERIATAVESLLVTSQATGGFLDGIVTACEWTAKGVDKLAARANKPVDEEKDKFHEDVLKAHRDQLEATKKLDERLFEFVNATKRIMRAMEGGVGAEDDTLIEAARDIRLRAADKGIDLTLEDAIKRAREQANYRG